MSSNTIIQQLIAQPSLNQLLFDVHYPAADEKDVRIRDLQRKIVELFTENVLLNEQVQSLKDTLTHFQSQTIPVVAVVEPGNVRNSSLETTAVMSSKSTTISDLTPTKSEPNVSSDKEDQMKVSQSSSIDNDQEDEHSTEGEDEDEDQGEGIRGSSLWNQRFEELKQFNEENGHFSVPKKLKSLYYWVASQRRSNKARKLSAERVKKLKSIGFPFQIDPKEKYMSNIEKKRERYIKELKEFKKVHGHLTIPRDQPKDILLSNWLAAQRRYKRTGKLKKELIDELNELGIDWNPKGSKSKDEDSEESDDD